MIFTPVTHLASRARGAMAQLLACVLPLAIAAAARATPAKAVCSQDAFDFIFAGSIDSITPCSALLVSASRGGNIDGLQCPCLQTVSQADAESHFRCYFDVSRGQSVFEAWQACNPHQLAGEDHQARITPDEHGEALEHLRSLNLVPSDVTESPITLCSHTSCQVRDGHTVVRDWHGHEAHGERHHCVSNLASGTCVHPRCLMISRSCADSWTRVHWLQHHPRTMMTRIAFSTP